MKSLNLCNTHVKIYARKFCDKGLEGNPIFKFCVDAIYERHKKPLQTPKIKKAKKFINCLLCLCLKEKQQ